MTDNYMPPDEFLKAMGLAILEWSRAERAIEWSLAEVSHGEAIRKHDDGGFLRLILNNMEVRTTSGLLKVVFRVRFPEDADEFDQLVDKLMKERARRDVIAHGAWLLTQKPGVYTTTMFKTVGKLGITPHNYTAAEITVLAIRIRTKAIALTEFLRGRGFWQGGTPPSAPDVPPPGDQERRG